MFGAIEVALNNIPVFIFLQTTSIFNKVEVSFLFFSVRKSHRKTNLLNKMFSHSKNVLFGKLSDLPCARSLRSRSNTFLVKFAPFSSRSRGSSRTFSAWFFFWFFWFCLFLQRGLLEWGLRDSPQRAVGILTMMGLQLLFMHPPCRPFTLGGGTGLRVHK